LGGREKVFRRAKKGAGNGMSKSTTNGGFTPAKKRVVAALAAIALALLLLLVVLLQVPSRPAYAATELRPDLGMAHFKHLQTETTSDGRRLLRFSSIIVNVGSGAFEVHGERPDTDTTNMTVTQRIFDDTGGHRDVATDAVMYYSGDGHNHWHVKDLEDFVLTRLDNGKLVGTGAKRGFCFYDNYRYGSEEDAYYTRAGGACGVEEDLQVFMGLSVGWGDMYRYTLRDQYIDITGLVSGRYRLWGTADPDNWFLEEVDTNNFTWVNLKLTANGVRVLKYGPSA
jgi:lysyl oxidase